MGWLIKNPTDLSRMTRALYHKASLINYALLSEARRLAFSRLASEDLVD